MVNHNAIATIVPTKEAVVPECALACAQSREKERVMCTRWANVGICDHHRRILLFFSLLLFYIENIYMGTHSPHWTHFPWQRLRSGELIGW